MTLLADANDKPSGSKYLLHTWRVSFIFQITNPSSHSSLHSLHAWIINKRQSAWRCLFPRRRCLYFFFIWTSQEGKRYFTLGVWVTARGAGCVCCRVWACHRNRDMKYLEGGGRSGGNENSRRHRSVQKKWPVSAGKFKSFIVGLRDTAAVYRHVTWWCG